MTCQVNNERYAFIRGPYLTICTLLLLIFTSGCESVNKLREAQDAFNQAASIENSLKLTSIHSGAIASLSSSRSAYASALLSINDIGDDDIKSLKDDHLWGTVLTLKALCQWRIGLYSKALETANDAKENYTEQIFPRDLAMLMALPGLIKTDQAYAKIKAFNKDKKDSLEIVEDLQEIKDLLTDERNGAVKDIQNARNFLEKKHPVQIYLIQAQLAAYRNYMVALYEINNQLVDEQDPARKKANNQLKAFEELIEKLHKEDSELKKLHKYWKNLCGF